MCASSIEWFEPAQGGRTFGVANLTNDSTVRDWANYHNTNCWSPDGRYVCFTRYASDGESYGSNEAAEVHIVDTHTGEVRRVDNGISPRWAHEHNWLFYVKFVGGSSGEESTEVRWLDVDSDRNVLMGHGLAMLGETSFDDRWIFGVARFRDRIPQHRSYRMRVQEGARLEFLMDGGSQWIPNPRYDVVFARFPNQDRDEAPFEATRYWFDIDGKNVRVGSPFIEQCHQSWLGNGEYYMLGNSQMRGRKWNEPFPSSLHFLSNARTGDVSPCGKNGRFVVGDKPMTVADLRSGDGWPFLEDLSIICYQSHVGDNSGPYDSDAKGSPDGTKVCFVSNYDLKDGAVTAITKSASETDDRVEVESTEGFPDSGEFVVFREVIRFSHKTPTSFEGLERKRYDTSGFGLREYSDLSKGELITPFLERCIPEDQWRKLPKPPRNILDSVGGLESPLARQRSTDIYAAVVRKPDRPYLMTLDGETVLVPGESHYETYGYSFQRGDERLNEAPIRPGGSFEVEAGSAIRAVSEEWSGLESEPSNEIEVPAGTTVRVLDEPPSEFSWTEDRWLVDGRSVDLKTGLQSAEAVKEVYHLYDGVIAREWYNWGTITKRHDLNANGKATRRLVYYQDDLFRREYYTAEGRLLSREFLDPEGNVTEMLMYEDQGGKPVEYDHWWFEKGMPERRIARRPARRVDSETPVMYLRSGNRWVLQDYAGKRPLPVES